VADYAPVWSPDDTKIAYTQAYEAPRVVSLATGTDTVIASPTTGLVYSPDWREAAAVVSDNARGYLLALVALGGTVATLDSAFPTQPAWSPDGERLAYVGPDEALYVIRSDGGDRRELAAHIYPYSSPAWSPDGSNIAFVVGNDVFIVPSAGGDARNLTASLQGRHVDPVWSPRGDALAVNSDFGARIDVVGLDGTLRIDAPSQLPVAYSGLALSWSPTGDELVYSHRFDPSNARQGVFALNLPTRVQRRLSFFGIDAAYSHRGDTIALGGTVTIESSLSEPGDCVGVGIWTIPAQGGTPTLVTRTCTDTPPTLSIHAPTSVDFGERADLGGGVLPGSASVVDLDVHACGRRPSAGVAVVDGGAWSTTVYPRVTTEYFASVGQASVKARVVVKPVVVVSEIGRLRYELRIEAGGSFAGRTVHVELRQPTGKSKLLRSIKLVHATRARFHLAARELHPYLESLYVAVPRTPCLAPAVSNDLPVARP
jgi:Tol biopolymer transport system component